MKIYLAADHAGFEMKNKVMAHLSELKYDVEDIGNKKMDQDDDYPQFAYAATTKLLSSDDNDPRAIMICGSGQGMCIAANRVRGIRGAMCWSEECAKETREDNDSNVLCLPSRMISEDQALKIIDTWLKTPFSDAPRHSRRIREIEEFHN